jgi:hypothetical protein
LTGQESRPQKPVPDYEQLKSQTEEMMIKVNEFYRGENNHGFLYVQFYDFI